MFPSIPPNPHSVPATNNTPKSPLTLSPLHITKYHIPPSKPPVINLKISHSVSVGVWRVGACLESLQLLNTLIDNIQRLNSSIRLSGVGDRLLPVVLETRVVHNYHQPRHSMMNVFSMQGCRACISLLLLHSPIHPCKPTIVSISLHSPSLSPLVFVI